MSDLDDALGRLGGPRAPLPPREGQREETARAVARRRRVKAALSSGAGFVTGIALLVGVLGWTASGAVTLEEQREFATPGVSASGSPQPSASAVGASTGGGPRASGSPEPEPTDTVDRRPSPMPSASGQRPPEPGAEAGSARQPVVRSETTLAFVCGNENGGVGGGTTFPGPSDWCLNASATEADGGYSLAATVCRNGAADGELAFRTRKEADFAIVDSTGAELWRWSRGQRFDVEQHAYQLTQSDCLRWTTSWDGVGDGGEELAPADLELVVDVDAEALRGKTAADDLA